jgi:glutamyl-tRNA reductase
MPLFAVGLNHNSAPLDVRERMVFSAEDLRPRLADLKAKTGIAEAVIISTCNRTELYTTLSPQCEAVIDWLCESQGVNPDWLLPHLYFYRGPEALQHLLRVGAGLDSMILGEPQILGQAKTAFSLAAEAGTVGHLLGRAFQHAFAVAKQVRTETSIGAHPVSVAYAAVTLAKQIFGELERSSALLIGAGETIELTARYLRDHGIGRMTIANRTIERAKAVAESCGAETITLSEIPEQLNHSDIVISSTAAPLPIIGKGSVERALKARKHKPIFMVDLAVPRDIEVEVSALKDVYLYTVDDLREVIEDNRRSRAAAAEQAEEIIGVQVEQFMGWVRSLDAVLSIRSLRERAEAQRRDVLERARKRLQAGATADEALEFLAATLTNTLLHAPTKGLREIAASGDAARVDDARKLLGLAEDDTAP